MKIPEFNQKYICIVDRNKPDLAAAISSYLHHKGTFLNVFEFPNSTILKPDHFTEEIDENYPSRNRSEELAIYIYNSIIKIGGCEYLILGGLSENQKSYLTFLNSYNYIEIDSVENVEIYLDGLADGKNEVLSVKSDEVLSGLFLAGHKGMKLKIDNTASSLSPFECQSNGLIVIEDNETTSTVSAINYALSMDLDVKIITPFSKDEIQLIKFLIEDWKNGRDESYNELTAIMYNKIEYIDFIKYEFATFFTEGAPFSLILKNQIPFSYVDLNKYPNLFIVNNIFIEKQPSIGSAIVFSPLEFGKDEEIEFVIKAFKDHEFWVKELIGENASSYNIDMHVKEYPYDIIHFCSHGGEVNGFSVTKEFIDRDGNKHTIDYDEVLSFYPQKDNELVMLESKQIWRKFDGLVWKSKELDAQNYPNYVFSDMINAIIEQDKVSVKYDGVPKKTIPNSCAIKCFDFIYQAMFNMVACFHTSPIVFNNTCWSWSGISDFFLHGGVRGYIGTLWAINNIVAKKSAETFYQHLFDDTILKSLHKATEDTKNTNSQDIYVYWGLHFSTLKKSDSVSGSRSNITNCLIRSCRQWYQRYKSLPDGKTKDNCIRLVEWDSSELFENFMIETLERKAMTKNQLIK